MKKIIYIFLLLCLCNIAGAQDPQFSQSYAIPTYLGPSFTGASLGDRLVINYRNQWPGIADAYETYSLSYDRNLRHLNSGVGMLIMRDKLSSALNKTIAGVQYSYNFLIKKPRFYIRPGLTFYYFNINYDVSNIVLGHQIFDRDITLPASNMPLIKDVNRVDFNASVITYTQSFWFGFGMDHLTRINESLTNTKSVTPIKYTVFGGYKFDFNRNNLVRYPERSVSVTFLYKKQADYDQLDFGLYWTRQPITLGIWYRGLPVKNEASKVDHDAIILLTGVSYSQFRISYSYDISISSIYLQSKGAHEITLTWDIPYRGPRKKYTAIPCPQI